MFYFNHTIIHDTRLSIVGDEDIGGFQAPVYKSTLTKTTVRAYMQERNR